MTYHIWGDEWFQEHGKELGEAMEFIMDYVQKGTFCYFSIKEKYGTIRYEFIHCRLWYIKWVPYWLKMRVCPILEKRAQRRASTAVVLAALKFPKVSPEILDDWIFCEYYEDWK